MIDNKQIDLLNLCLEDSLFAALYEALSRLQQIWQTPSPVDMWVMALSARRNLDKSRRPDLLAGQLFGDADPHEAVVVEALVMWMMAAMHVIGLALYAFLTRRKYLQLSTDGNAVN